VSLSLRLIQIPTTARPIALGETFSFKGTAYHAFSSALIPIWNLRISAAELRTRVTGGRKRVPGETKEFSSHKQWNAARSFEHWQRTTSGACNAAKRAPISRRRPILGRWPAYAVSS